MSHSSRLSIPLLLIIFVALAVPLIARAVTEADVLPGAKYCPWYKGFWCQDANRANGFTGDGTMTLAQYQARNSASSPVTRAPAPASTEPDPSVWVKDSTGAYFLKSDLKSSAPATKTLTPLEKYQAQF